MARHSVLGFGGPFRAVLTYLTVSLWLAATPLAAQQATPQTAAQPVLILDVSQLVGQSLRGQQLIAAKEEATRQFHETGEARMAALEAEERELTEQRETLSEQEFLALADAFDKKAVATRQENAARQQKLAEQIAALDAAFQAELGPVVISIMRERSADVVLQKRVVFLNSATVDITRDVIARMDKAAGLR